MGLKTIEDISGTVQTYVGNKQTLNVYEVTGLEPGTDYRYIRGTSNGNIKFDTGEGNYEGSVVGTSKIINGKYAWEFTLNPINEGNDTLVFTLIGNGVDDPELARLEINYEITSGQTSSDVNNQGGNNGSTPTSITVSSETGLNEITTPGGQIQLSVVDQNGNTYTNVTYRSGDTSIATVDQSGLVTAVSNGTVRINITSNTDDNLQNDIELIISGQVDSSNSNNTNEPTNLLVLEGLDTNAVMYIGTHETTKVCVEPKGLKPGVDYKSITAESSNSNAIEVVTQKEDLYLAAYGAYVNIYKINAKGLGFAMVTLKLIGLNDEVIHTIEFNCTVVEQPETDNTVPDPEL